MFIAMVGTLCVQNQITNILGFAGHTVCIAATQYCFF